jgi:hypothetical protein
MMHCIENAHARLARSIEDLFHMSDTLVGSIGTGIDHKANCNAIQNGEKPDDWI